jgi:hypothetical protein
MIKRTSKKHIRWYFCNFDIFGDYNDTIRHISKTQMAIKSIDYWYIFLIIFMNLYTVEISKPLWPFVLIEKNELVASTLIATISI